MRRRHTFPWTANTILLLGTLALPTGCTSADSTGDDCTGDECADECERDKDCESGEQCSTSGRCEAIADAGCRDDDCDDTEDDDADDGALSVRVGRVLPPVGGASVTVRRLSDGKIIAKGSTDEDGDILLTEGADKLKEDELYVVEVAGGRTTDDEKTKQVLHAVAAGDQLQQEAVTVTYLSELIHVYVQGGLESNERELIDQDGQLDIVVVLQYLDDLADALVAEDIDGDDDVDYDDVLDFDPSKNASDLSFPSSALSTTIEVGGIKTTLFEALESGDSARVAEATAAVFGTDKDLPSVEHVPSGSDDDADDDGADDDGADDDGADDDGADDDGADDDDADDDDADDDAADDDAADDDDADDDDADDDDADDDDEVPDVEIDCVFTSEVTLSSAISTVGIATWDVDVTDLLAARIEFGLSGTDLTQSAPVKLEGADHRTLLLGMKADREYDYRVFLQTRSGWCTSTPKTFTTGSLPSGLPTFSVTGTLTPGFVTVTPYMTATNQTVFIIDADGDVVWWYADGGQVSRARLDWAGEMMYLMQLNVPRASGGLFRGVSLDGLTQVDGPSEFQNAHHDFTVLPDGTVTAIVYGSDADYGGCTSIVEWLPESGEVTAIVPSTSSLYEITNDDCHSTSLLYHPEDDTYTMGESYAGLYLKFDRAGDLLWQFGGQSPLGNSFALNGGEDYEFGGYGHHLVDGNRLLFHSTTPLTGKVGAVFEYTLDEGNWTATLTREFPPPAPSSVLGDVQALPGGHTLVSSPQGNRLQELDDAESVVWELQTTQPLGYVMHRQTLYGPPPR